MNAEELSKRLENLDLGKYQDDIKAAAKPCIRLLLNKADDSAIPVGTSKMGGLPDLPDSIQWPYETEPIQRPGPSYFSQKPKSSPLLPFSFIAQINLADVKPFDPEGLLPDTGILYFFYSDVMQVWGFDPADKCGFKVLYFDGPMTDLRRRDIPKGTEITVFDPCRLTAQSEISFPDNYGMDSFTKDESYAYFSLIDEYPINKMFGYADIIQREMELECEMVSNGLYAGDGTAYKDPRQVEFKRRSSDWLLLLQVDSNEKECGMMWGDVGRIYYWIRKDDLLSGDFEKSWLILQCS